MNVFRAITALILPALIVPVVSAQIKIDQIWVECSQSDLLIHYNFEMNGHIGKECEFISYFFLGEEEIKDTNGLFRTKSGAVSASTHFMPIRNNRTYDDFIVAIPITELHIPAGVIKEEPVFAANRIGIKFGILYKGRFLYLSDETETHYIDLSYVNCVLCGGSGDCRHCHGTGHDYIDNSNCSYCKKSGICARCDGGGTEIEYPIQCINLGNIRENSNIDTSIGTTIKETPFEWYTYETNENDDNNTAYDVCPECNGKGYAIKQYKYAGGSHMPIYHNFSGLKCNICGDTTKHYHYKCSVCRKY